MRIIKLLAAATITLSPAYVFPASAQTTEQWEQMDIAYEQCKATFISRNMGDDTAASNYCYPRIYGGETSGGGVDEYPLPGPVYPCYGSNHAACDPYRPF